MTLKVAETSTGVAEPSARFRMYRVVAVLSAPAVRKVVEVSELETPSVSTLVLAV
jgi:hypothetical protein